MKLFTLFCLACIVLASAIYAAEPNAVAQPQTASVSARFQNIEGDLDIDIPVMRDEMTITESTQIEELKTEDIGKDYNFRSISEDFSQALEDYNRTEGRPHTNKVRKQMRDAMLGLALEFVITLIVLQIALSLSGFPCLFWQIALLALTVAIPGGLMDYFYSFSLLNPIRMALSFILLLALIRPLSDVREWATAIRIVLIARSISIVLVWLAFTGVMVLFEL